LERPLWSEPFTIVFEVERPLAGLFVIELDGACRNLHRETTVELGGPVIGRAHDASGMVRINWPMLFRYLNVPIPDNRRGIGKIGERPFS